LAESDFGPEKSYQNLMNIFEWVQTA
jgi:hypothetical protein